MRPWIAVLWLLLLLTPGCGESEDLDPREESFRAALAAATVAGDLQQGGNQEAARESYRRAHDLALAALKADGRRARVEILNLLSNVCLELGSWSPEFLARSVRYARQALRERPEWPLPRFNLGVAYARAGHLDEARTILRQFLDAHEAIVKAHPNETIRDPGARDGLIMVLIESGIRALKRDRVGAEGVARGCFEEAWRLAPDAGRNARAQEMLGRLNQDYADRVNAAAKEGDLLEVARTHASFGHFLPAEEALAVARKKLGRTMEVRWVETRYLEEMRGNEEGIAEAARHYEEFIAAGERVVHAVAGLARCLRALGRGEEVLERFGDFPEPTPELRRELILLRLDRIRGLPREDARAAEEEFTGIDALFQGGLDPEDRMHLLLDAGAAALARGDEARLRNTIRELENRYPGNAGVVILQAGLDGLVGTPLPGLTARERDG